MKVMGRLLVVDDEESIRDILAQEIHELPLWHFQERL